MVHPRPEAWPGLKTQYVCCCVQECPVYNLFTSFSKQLGRENSSQSFGLKGAQ